MSRPVSRAPIGARASLSLVPSIQSMLAGQGFSVDGDWAESKRRKLGRWVTPVVGGRSPPAGLSERHPIAVTRTQSGI
jgi:hypothetical protein